MTRFSTTILLTVLIGLSPLAKAAQILRSQNDGAEIVLKQIKKAPLHAQEHVCFYRAKVEVACGEVTDVSDDEAVVKISARHEAIRKVQHSSAQNTYVELVFDKGEVQRHDQVVRPDTVEVAQVPRPRRAQRKTASAPPEPLNEKNGSDDSAWSNANNDISSQLIDGLRHLDRDPAAIASEEIMEGKDDLQITNRIYNDDDLVGMGYESDISLGVTYIFPDVQFQQAVTEHLAVGLLASYLNTPVGNGSLAGGGGYLTLNAYGQEPFHGLWGQLGVGMYALNATSPGLNKNFSSVAGIGNVGWRWLWKSGLNFGAGAGVQYLLTSKPAGSSLQFGGLLPSITMDLGFAF